MIDFIVIVLLTSSNAAEKPQRNIASVTNVFRLDKALSTLTTIVAT